MTRLQTTVKSLSRLRSDAKQKIKGFSDSKLRTYIGRIAVRMLAADKLLRDRGGPANTAFTATAAKMLELVEPLALGEIEDDE